MTPAVSRLDLTARRRSLTAYTIGGALYTLIVIAVYPAFKNSTGLDKLIKNDPTVAALFGVTGSLTSPGGWLNANLYANFIPLILLLVTIGYGAAALAGQDDDRTLCLIATLPIRRAVIVTQKAAAMALQAAVVAATAGAVVLVGRAFDLTIAVPAALSISAAVTLLGLDFGIIALALGALTGKRGLAIGVPAAIAAASYLIASLAPTVSWIRPGRYASLFYWTVANNQITKGVTGWDYLVTIAFGLLALYAATVAFNRLDLH